MHRPRKRALEECEWKPGGGFELIARPSATAKAVGGPETKWVVDTAGLLMEAAFEVFTEARRRTHPCLCDYQIVRMPEPDYVQYKRISGGGCAG
jgi:hypothetical protein